MKEEALIIEELSKEFELEKSAFDLDKFLGVLQNQITQLLIGNTEKLRWILYRIDVSEAMAAKAMAEPNIEKISAALTHLIYQRQLAKIKTRNKNSTSGFIDF